MGSRGSAGSLANEFARTGSGVIHGAALQYQRVVPGNSAFSDEAKQ
jgi:hypothetical protein